MNKAWNKGLTKETNVSVRKISQTMKRNKIDNFLSWRNRMKEEGKLNLKYAPFKKDGNLAELIGVTLGDGNICKFPRTEALRIVGNCTHKGFVKHYADMVEIVFNKKPHVAKRNDSSASNITIYQKYISRRLGIPTGSKRDLKVIVPKWILKNKNYICRYLRGLYESDGSYSVHKPTYTYKFVFTNKNQTLLDIVYGLIKRLGFHPHVSKYNVQISRKEEVQKIRHLLEFRKY